MISFVSSCQHLHYDSIKMFFFHRRLYAKRHARKLTFVYFLFSNNFSTTSFYALVALITHSYSRSEVWRLKQSAFMQFQTAILLCDADKSSDHFSFNFVLFEHELWNVGWIFSKLFPINHHCSISHNASVCLDHGTYKKY